jgi:hypothetical protein
MYLFLFPVAPALEHRAPVKQKLQFLNPNQLVGLLGLAISQLQGPLPMQDNTNTK